MGRKLSLLLLMTMLISSLSLPALAAPGDTEAATETVTINTPSDLEDYVQSYEKTTDVEYSGPLDPLTGLPAKDPAGENSSYVILQEGSYGYDKEQHCYVNEVGALSFTSNIPNGAVLSSGKQNVSFTFPGGLSAMLYCNGEALTEANLTNITEPGAYILEVAASNSSDGVSFSFRILGETTNTVTEFSLPSSFRFDSIMLEEEILTPDYINYTQLMEDGAYEITWACEEIGQRYTTSFVLDTVAPTLELPEVTDGEAHSEVTLTDLEPGARIVLEEKKTGKTETIIYADTKIKDAGTYHLTVYDAAGNATSYDFTIHVYLNLSAFAALGLVLAGILGLWFYSRYIKKHPRVG